jgi:hypothetical protein
MGRRGSGRNSPSPMGPVPWVGFSNRPMAAPMVPNNRHTDVRAGEPWGTPRPCHPCPPTPSPPCWPPCSILPPLARLVGCVRGWSAGPIRCAACPGASAVAGRGWRSCITAMRWAPCLPLATFLGLSRGRQCRLHARRWFDRLFGIDTSKRCRHRARKTQTPYFCPPLMDIEQSLFPAVFPLAC